MLHPITAVKQPCQQSSKTKTKEGEKVEPRRERERERERESKTQGPRKEDNKREGRGMEGNEGHG